jgi:diguanylate cyclase (GGDEF)-like protein
MICLLASGVTAQEIWHNRAADLDNSGDTTFNLAQSLSQQATDSFQTVDGVLQELVERAETDGTGPRALARSQLEMAVQVKQLRVLHNLFLIDAAGDGVVNAKPGLKNANYRDRPYFLYHRTHASRASHIGHTVRSRTDGTWIITITRRLNAPDGRFAGVALATISGKYFLHLYDRVDLGRSGIIMLVLDDGTIQIRKPFEQADVGKSIATSAMFRSMRQDKVAGTYEQRSVIDGVMRHGAYHRVSRYPLFVVVGQATDEILAPWRLGMAISLIELAGIIAIVCVLGGYLTRQIGKREIAEAQLARLVLVDGLTGLGNRHQFDAVLDREWRRAVRTRASLAFLMIDADDFKAYNDRYGHQAGDDVLKRIARCIQGAYGRPGDLSARYGGEEFAVFLPDTDAPGAFAVAETIRRAVVALNIPHAGSAHHVVTVSIGVGRMSPTGTALPSALVKAADSALYEAKSKGRNRTQPAVRFVPTIVGAIPGAFSERA